MDLGAFSVSLAVENLEVSRDFYTKLGFEVVGGDGQNWQVLRNGIVTLGLFQGMFDGNVLTFNPGWDAMYQDLEEFTDVRELQIALKKQGVRLDSELDEATSGPASIMLTDPDGNRILIDQHR
ncbi:MAG: VOC family protein [Woeseiaceae bacterium]|nr:VOC family protein [Woeseiaceae bacterium]